MLTEEQLEAISEAIQPLFQALEQDVIHDVARRIKKTMTYTRTAELQAMFMRELGYSPAKIRSEAMKILMADADFRKAVAKNTLAYKNEITKLINELTNEAYKACDKIIADAGCMAWVNDLSVWKLAGKDLADDSYLKQLIQAVREQTRQEMKNLSQTSGFKVMSGFESVQKLYQNELDKAIVKVCSGTFDPNKVLRDIVHDLSRSGLRTIDYASGRSMQLDTAARVALRTGCHQMAGQIQAKNIMNTGVNLVHVKSHWGARNTGTGHANHEQWQGKVYYIKPADYTAEAQRIGRDKITDLWEATGYSIDGTHPNDPLGLFGYNCRHLYYAFFEGISKVHEPDKEPGPFLVDGKEIDYYTMTQKLRSMERNIRGLKRERDALKRLGFDTTEIDAKIKRKAREYSQFCDSCGVPSATSKLRYESGSADLSKTKAWVEYKKVQSNREIIEKSAKCDIIISNVNGSSVLTSSTGLGRMPNRITASTSQNKLQRYLLNSNHPVGKYKAEVLNSVLGYNYSNWNILSDKIFDAIQTTDVSKIIQTNYGTKYVIPVDILGERGRHMVLNTVWQIDIGSNIPRMITTTFSKKGVK